MRLADPSQHVVGDYDNIPLSQRFAALHRPRLSHDHGDHDDDNVENNDNEEEEEEDEGNDSEQEMALLAKPIGDSLRVSGKGKKRKRHYAKFEYDGNEYKLGDTVLLTPDNLNAKPYVAIIKDITGDIHNYISITGQWFYRPEEAVREGGGIWEAQDNRVLYYSAHVDVFPAETVMHTCVIHVIPTNKKFPIRTKQPGFIVQKFYNTETKELSVLSKDLNIDTLFQRTFEHIGELPDIDDVPLSPVDSTTKKKNHTPSLVPKVDGPTNGTKQVKRDDKQGSNQTDISLYMTILKKFKALTGIEYRDRWLGTLLQEIEATCTSMNDTMVDDTNVRVGDVSDKSMKSCNQSGTSTDLTYNAPSAGESLWRNAAIKAITSLERAAHDVLSGDHLKYNQKLRALRFNLKKSSTLAKRLLNKELDPVVIVNMSPDELKMGFTAEERKSEEPEISKQMQMTNTRCLRCSEKNVGIAEIIHRGRGDMYKMECCGCGRSWFASRDAIAL